MKRLASLIIILCLASVTSMAQRKAGFPMHCFSPEQYRKELQEFITKEVGLTIMESEAFFPMFFEMQDKQRESRDKVRDVMDSIDDNASEEEYQSLIELMNKQDIVERQIEQSYIKKFHKVISYKKIYEAKKAERKFSMKALAKYAPPPKGRPVRQHKAGKIKR